MVFCVINYNLLETRIHYYNTTRYTISKYKDLIAFSSGMKLLNSDETPFSRDSYQWVQKNVESTFSRNSTGMRFYIPNMLKKQVIISFVNIKHFIKRFSILCISYHHFKVTINFPYTKYHMLLFCVTNSILVIIWF